MSQRPAKIADAEAHALWERAIEIQAAAERGRPEFRSLPAQRAEYLSLEEVVEVAKDAGVDPNYMYLALAERGLPDAEKIRRDRRVVRWARLVTRAGDAIEISQLIDAPPERVAAAFAAVVAKPFFALSLEDRVGPNPPYDGVLVYRVVQPAGWGTSMTFHGAMAMADIRVMMLALSAEGARTRLHLRLPYFAHGANLSVAGMLAGCLGASGGYGGAVAGSAIAGMLGSAALSVIAAPAAMGLLAGGALGVAGSRGLMRWGVRKGEVELRRLLKVVALEAEGGAPYHLQETSGL